MDFLLTASFDYNISIGICAAYSNAFTTCLSSTFLANLNALKQRYIIIDSGFSKTLMYTLFTWGTGIIINTANPWVSTYTLAGLGTTGTLQAFLAWKGFNLTLPDSSLRLDLQVTWTFTSYTDLEVTISTTAPGDITFQAGFFSLICYNVEDTAAWPFPAAILNYNTFAGANSTPAIYTDTNSIMQDYNTFWGLTRLYF